MVASTFDPIAFPFVIGKEGGYDRDPHDRGNWTSGKIGVGELKGTKYGVAAHVYPHLDIKNLTVEDARKIQRRDYADKVAYDALPAGVDVSVFDMAYNAGPGRSLKLLNAALATGTSLSTAASLAAVANATSDKVALIKRFALKRLGFYQSLNNGRYIKGWTNRATACEALSVKTWLTVGAQLPAAAVKTELEAEGKKAGKSAARNGAGASTTAGAETAHQTASTPAPAPQPSPIDANGMPHDAAASIDWSLVLGVSATVAAVALAVWFGWRWWVHRQRAQAYREAAQSVALPAIVVDGVGGVGGGKA